MTVKKIKFLVGMPGSGKTTLGNALLKEAFPSGSMLFIDDISIVTNNAKDYLSKLNVENVSEIVISDVFLCRKKVRESAMEAVCAIFPDVEIEIVYFENSTEKCLINVEKRTAEGDDRKVSLLIKQLTKEYVIPEGIIPLEIKHDTSSKLKI